MTIDLDSLQRLACAWLPVLLNAAVKGTVLLAAAGLLAIAMRKASAAARQMVWMLALASLLALPLASAALPGWQVLPGWVKIETPVDTTPAPAADAAGSLGGANPAGMHDAPTPPPDLSHAPAAPPEYPAELPADVPPMATVARGPAAPDLHAASETAATEEFRWTALVPAAVGLWLGGTLICLLPLALGRLSLWRLARRSRRIDGGSWRRLTRRAAGAVGLRRGVVLLQSDAEPMPMVWGVLRPKLLLPAEADAWSADRRWVVLLHELAHAKRHDCLAKLIAHVACAAYWFNPLCWIAFKRMQTEAEAACDDLVLASGHKPSDYATHLLELASGLRAGMLAAYSSIAMARKSKLEGRLLAILDGKRNRRSLTRLGVLLAAILLAALVIPISILKATAADKPAALSQEPATQPVGKVSVEAKLQRLWEALGSADAKEADEAVKALVALGDRAVAFLAGRFEPAPADAGHLKALIARLDDDKYAVRKKAHNELMQLGLAALPGLKQALKRPKLPAEARTRINAIVKDLNGPLPGSARAWRWERALDEVLVPIGSVRSKALLTRLAKGDPGGRLTRLAERALDPWGKEAGGLRARVTAHRKRCTAGEPMLFTIEVKNVTDHDVAIWTHIYLECFDVTDTDGRRVRLEQRTKWQRPRFRKQPLVLKPKEVHRVTADINWLYFWLPDGKARTFLLTWGDSMQVGPKGNKTFLKLASRPVTITIAPGKGPSWGGANDGLACRLLPASQTIEVPRGTKPKDIDVRLTYELWNVGKKATRAPARRYAPLQSGEAYFFRIITPENRGATYLGKPIKAGAPRPKDFILMAPGKRISRRVRLPYDFSKPGKYSIRTGPLNSNIVTIEVVPARAGGTTVRPGSPQAVRPGGKRGPEPLFRSDPLTAPNHCCFQNQEKGS